MIAFFLIRKTANLHELGEFNKDQTGGNEESRNFKDAVQ